MADLFGRWVPDISIHAPARGATVEELKRKIAEYGFQSTLPRGERQIPAPREKGRKYISIHAPARGATGKGGSYDKIWRNFNPRSREGSDQKWTRHYTAWLISIHAPARGATRSCLTRVSRIGTFQSTLPRGERPWTRCFHASNMTISIHAPARGATAILTKNPFDFLAKIDKIYYYLLPFSFYNILSFLSRTLFMHFSGANLPAILCVPPIRTSVFRYNFK